MSHNLRNISLNRRCTLIVAVVIHACTSFGFRGESSWTHHLIIFPDSETPPSCDSFEYPFPMLHSVLKSSMIFETVRKWSPSVSAFNVVLPKAFIYATIWINKFAVSLTLQKQNIYIYRSYLEEDSWMITFIFSVVIHQEICYLIIFPVSFIETSFQWWILASPVHPPVSFPFFYWT